MDIGPVSITPSAPLTVTVGRTVNLQCSVDITPHPLPAGTLTPVFEWFFGRTFAQPLTSTTTNSGSTYTSTYNITAVRESDAGMYTCRLRGNQRTAVNTVIIVGSGEAKVVMYYVASYSACYDTMSCHIDEGNYAMLVHGASYN